MKLLIVTEKCSPLSSQRDGGARVVETLKRAFPSCLKIVQFGPEEGASATWHFDYPNTLPNRFERRLANASFIGEHIQKIAGEFSHIIFIHVSMQFGLVDFSLSKKVEVWTFPMFLTPSYQASGEVVPKEYLEKERQALKLSDNILTPSHLERMQLTDLYGIDEKKIHVVPRGVNMSLLAPKERVLSYPLQFCSVGSIKHQKNTFGLIGLFAKVTQKFPDARLKVIGPVQDSSYAKAAQAKANKLGLKVEWRGPVLPKELAEALEGAHFHLSMASCETFGRAIFETLASGLPNIAQKEKNAAAEYLEHLPYARFVQGVDEALKAIEEILPNYEMISSRALEIGTLFDDVFLSRLLISKICKRKAMGVADFDGTLYHKDDPEKTKRCIAAFKKFELKVLCSARSLEDLLYQLDVFKLKVDWIIASSGAIVSKGSGVPLWVTPITSPDLPKGNPITFNGNILQVATSLKKAASLKFRTETYQEESFISHWQASKLHAVHRLLKTLDWSGQVHVFGDGPYDRELITYFDGTLITPTPQNNRQQQEITYG